GGPRLRRPPARRHHRFPQLHFSADPPDLAIGTPAARPRVLADFSPAGEHLRVLSGQGQDRRWLLPWFSLTLERGGLLSLCSTPGIMGQPGGDRGSGRVYLRAQQVPLPITAGAAQPGGHNPGRSLDGPARLADLARAEEHEPATRSVNPASRCGHPVLPGLLPG